MTNRIELSGVIRKEPIRRQSPSGIVHCSFTLEHRSIRQEAGLDRQVLCYMPVVCSSRQGSSLDTQYLVQGMNIMVSGFMTYQSDRKGSGKLVLHAQNITYL